MANSKQPTLKQFIIYQKMKKEDEAGPSVFSEHKRKFLIDSFSPSTSIKKRKMNDDVGAKNTKEYNDLIEKLQNHPALYDKTSPDYADREIHWLLLATETKTPKDKVKYRVRRILQKYKMERTLNSSWRFFKKLHFLEAAMEKDDIHLESDNEETSHEQDELSSNHSRSNSPVDTKVSNKIETVDLVSSDEENEVSSSHLNPSPQSIDPPALEPKALCSDQNVINPSPPEINHSALIPNEFHEKSFHIKHELSQNFPEDQIPPEEIDMYTPKVEMQVQECEEEEQEQAPTSSENFTDNSNEAQYPKTDYTNFGNFVHNALNTLSKPARNKKILEIFEVINETFGDYISDSLQRMPFQVGQEKQNEILKVMMKR